MWLRPEKDEINRILSNIPPDPLADRLTKAPHPDTATFVRAVATSDDIEVDGDTLILRGDEGAFAMTWSWVSNEQAGLPEFNDEDEPTPSSGI